MELPTEIEFSMLGTTMKLPIQYGTAIKEEDGEVWDHDALWYPGDRQTPDEAWRKVNEEFVQDPDEPPQTLVLVWRAVSEYDDWVPVPTPISGGK